jgi:hypothetical protein
LERFSVIHNVALQAKKLGWNVKTKHQGYEEIESTTGPEIVIYTTEIFFQTKGFLQQVQVH